MAKKLTIISFFVFILFSLQCFAKDEVPTQCKPVKKEYLKIKKLQKLIKKTKKRLKKKVSSTLEMKLILHLENLAIKIEIIKEKIKEKGYGDMKLCYEER